MWGTWSATVGGRVSWIFWLATAAAWLAVPEADEEDDMSVVVKEVEEIALSPSLEM
jgi:hypothetical protein